MKTQASFRKYRSGVIIQAACVWPTREACSVANCLRELTIVLAQGSDDDLVIPLDNVPPSQTVAGLKALIEPLFNIPRSEQQLIYNNRRLQQDASTLESLGVVHGDMISVLPRQAAPPPAPATLQQPTNTTNTSSSQGAEAEAETIRLQALGEPRILEQLRNANPPLAAAVEDPQSFGRLWAELRNSQQEQEREKQRRMARLEADPFDIEAQREIEEQIRQEQVQKNLDFAMEWAPECKYRHRIE